MKTVVILQSSYIPWKGYFDLIAAADEFVIFDEVQFTKRDWRNRNRVIVNGEARWLSIPVLSKSRYEQPIDTVEISDHSWTETHWRTLKHAYGRSPFFAETEAFLEPAYRDAQGETRLTNVNESFLRKICDHLAIDTPFIRSEVVPRTTSDPTGRLVEICVGRGATRYLSGPAARAYIDREQFDRVGIELAFADYSGYPAYVQPAGTFEHGVSIVDLLCAVGRVESRAHLKSLRDPSSFMLRA